jgi:hypothetical protein
MTRALTRSRCCRCEAELTATGRLAEYAHAEGLCSDCWLCVPEPANDPMPACSRCALRDEGNVEERK